MRFYIWVLLTSLCLLSGCENEEENTQGNGDFRQEVLFSLSPVTYATDTRFEEGDLIGIYAVKRGTDMKASGNYADNKKFRFEGGTVIPFTDRDKIYFMQDESLDFYAYHPYKDKIEDATGIHFTVSEDQSEKQILSDLLWASNKTAVAGKPVPLNFIHKLSLVQVKFNSASGKQPASARIYGISPSLSLNLQSGIAFTTNQKKQSNKMSLYEKDGDSYTYRWLMPEQQINKGDSLFSFEVGTDKRVFKAVEDIVLKAGIKNPFECAFDTDRSR